MKKSFESLFATYGTISAPAPLFSTDAWPPSGLKDLFIGVAAHDKGAAPQLLCHSPPGGRQIDSIPWTQGADRPAISSLHNQNAASLFLPEAGGVSDCRKTSGCAGLFRQNGVRKPGCARLANPPHMSMDSELVRRTQALRPSQACRSFSRDAPCRRSRWLPCRGHSARR